MTTMDEFKITVASNGPLLAKGPIEITDPAGNVHHVPDGVSVALCRCGLSGEKPFCTGNHRGNFAGEEAITRTFG